MVLHIFLAYFAIVKTCPIRVSDLKSLNPERLLLFVAIAMPLLTHFCFFVSVTNNTDPQSKAFPMSVFQSAWYLIYTRIRYERKVVNELKKRDIEFYWPTRQSLREWRNRRKLVEQPLFPSYVFVRLKSMEDYYVGLKIEGTMFYVKSGKDVVVVDEKIITNLKMVVGNVPDIEVTAESFRPGQKVVIKEGALCGMTCEVVQYQKKERIIVRLNMLNRNILIDVPESQLMTADANNYYSLAN